MKINKYNNSVKEPTIRISSIIFYFLLLLVIFSTIIFLSQQSLSSLIDSISDVSFYTLLGATIALFGYFFIRGVRWWMILRHLGHSTRKKTAISSYFAQQITNFSSTLFLGGPLRIFLVSKLEHVPPHIGFVSLSREILTDLLALLTIIAISLLIDLILPYGFLDFVLTTLNTVLNELAVEKQLQAFLFLLGISIVGLLLLFTFIGKFQPDHFQKYSEKAVKIWGVLKHYNTKDATIELILSIAMYFSLIFHYEILFIGVTDIEFNMLVSIASLSVFIFLVTIIPIRIGVAEITLIGLSRLLEIPLKEAIIVSIISRGIISLFALLAVPLATRMIKQSINQHN